ncbi:hypothetical protein QQS21_005177 [Conoideocrella luteorostrata]|uniref:Glucose-methanol-choline oxidoreductase N-terminal domain-containing protein n=1 Tax=Conoideocrella luteorostrata TaxID=1105319 RepID=A0AAJ0FZ90_9HYPO|nr:hypothetical protein QQS21_005177 [Conoideocrella luteorostrata]
MAEEYDFIIVGGGTAGLTVASRLSEDVSKSVLVLEAGSDLTEDPRVNIPIFYAALLGSEADWKFRSQPQPGLNGRVLGLNQGKALGGSSALNAQVFVPPFENAINSWERLGNPGWNWASLQGYLSKAYRSPVVSHDAKVDLATEDWPELNHAKGPIQTSFGNETHPIRKAWTETFRSAGQNSSRDPFIHSSVGAFSCLASIDSHGQRSYSASAYYKPNKLRRNLHVLTNTHVERILLNKSGAGNSLKAVGIQYRNKDTKITVNARKEVILAAGAFQSPKLLELSGIGGAELLHQHGIDVAVNLPGVGQNLQDHPIMYTAFKANNNLQTKDSLIRQEPEAFNQAMQEYKTTGNGPLASLGVHTYAYLPLVGQDRTALTTLFTKYTPENQQGYNVAQAYYDIARATILDPNQPSAAYLAALGQTNYAKDLNDDENAPAASPGKFVTFGVMLSQPLSRGTVHIASADPGDSPIIDPGYLSNALDVEVIARHMLRIKPLAQSSQFVPVLEQPLKFRDPLADFQGDLEAAKTYARKNLVSMWHFAGSCAMLPRDKNGVVDSHLNVYGVEGLRVVDASAIPLISTANSQATVYAFAEKAADLIKQDWKDE